jgi:hypothetical protein
MDSPAKRARSSGPPNRLHVLTQLRAKTCEIQWDVLNFKDMIRNSVTIKDKLVQDIKFRFSTTSEVLLITFYIGLQYLIKNTDYFLYKLNLLCD